MARQVVKAILTILLGLSMMGLYGSLMGEWTLTSGETIEVPCPVNSSDPMKLPKSCPAPSPLVCVSTKRFTEETVELNSLRRQVENLTQERDDLKRVLQETLHLAEEASRQSFFEKVTVGALSCGVCAGGGLIFRSEF